MKTNSKSIYLSPSLFPCTASPTELCPPNGNIILAVTHTLAFQTLHERKPAREFRSPCDLSADVPKALTSTFWNHKKPKFHLYMSFISSQVNSDSRPKGRATEVWKEIITRTVIISTRLRCVQ